jgi:VWFA-related protein
VLVGTLASALLLTAPIASEQATFRSVVDVIAVDVQVVDTDGNPIGSIGPDAFEVSINGQKRKVISAQFVAKDDPNPRPEADRRSGVTPDAGGRTFVLAVDSASFEVGTEKTSIEGARSFVQQLNPTDRVGLFVYPVGARIAPTTERAVIWVNLERVVGQKDPIRSHYHLRPWEIVDITGQSTNPQSFLTAPRGREALTDPATQVELDPVLRIQRRECPEDNTCPAKIFTEGMGLATQLERQVEVSLGGLDGLLRALEEIPGRKAVVLVSAGMLVSDRPDGRPDVGDVARVMGQAAARANATVYTVHVDTVTSGMSHASQKDVGSSEVARDRALYGNWLTEFSAAAGGRLIYVPSGSTEFAFKRVLRETSAYYLLGVEPAPADRDGKPRQLKVKVNKRGVNVRSRQWVVIPAKG